MRTIKSLVLLTALWTAGPAIAAGIDGTTLSAWWGLPFAGMLLSIAIMPLAVPQFWHHHFGKIAAGWSLLFLVPFAVTAGPGAMGRVVVHTLMAEYIPFIVLLSVLFAVAGGIYIRGNLHGSPNLNTGIMATGAVLASFMGTTGASMLLISPLIRANEDRKQVAHVIVFFIFIVSNAGGSLTPLGDPPLFLGFLKGVDFFWTMKHIFPETLFMVGTLLLLFYVIDGWFLRREFVVLRDPTPEDKGFGIEGIINLPLLLAVVGLVLMSGTWKPDIHFNIAGTEVGLPQLVRDGLLLVVMGLSLWLTPQRLRQANRFSWAPMQEVGKLFIGIFLTMVPVLAILKAGGDGDLAVVARAVTGPDGQPLPWAYFWFSGALSSFLDNAPAYLVFFNLAGGNAAVLMTTLAPTLAAISAGSVFMGANTYIGNAPNFMVKAIAEDRGIKMPSFFGYMLWSGAILVPLFIVMTFIWFR